MQHSIENRLYFPLPQRSARLNAKFSLYFLNSPPSTSVEIIFCSLNPVSKQTSPVTRSYLLVSHFTMSALRHELWIYYSFNSMHQTSSKTDWHVRAHSTVLDLIAIVSMPLQGSLRRVIDHCLVAVWSKSMYQNSRKSITQATHVLYALQSRRIPIGNNFPIVHTSSSLATEQQCIKQTKPTCIT